MGVIFSFFPAILMPSTFSERNDPCFRWTNIHSQFGPFYHPNSNKASSICLSQNIPATGWPFWVSFKRDLQCLPRISAILCRGRRIQTSGHSDSWILSNLGASCNFSWDKADAASATYPSQLAITRALFSEHCMGSRVVFLQYHFGARLCLCTSEIWVPNPHFEVSQISKYFVFPMLRIMSLCQVGFQRFAIWMRLKLMTQRFDCFLAGVILLLDSWMWQSWVFEVVMVDGCSRFKVVRILASTMQIRLEYNSLR